MKLYQEDILYDYVNACSTIIVPPTCFPGYYGSMCTDKCNCTCDKVTGSCSSATECLSGFFGPNCDSVCHCDSCNRTTGCTDKECMTGFYGPHCETECHCLNGEACDRVTGKCKTDPTTQLSLCEPGHSSNTGFNLDNCQKGILKYFSTSITSINQRT